MAPQSAIQRAHCCCNEDNLLEAAELESDVERSRSAQPPLGGELDGAGVQSQEESLAIKQSSVGRLAATLAAT
ncbi:hypothetical protein PGT21_010149 [Puccinia graminis f. sp. tritici]|uniref:Uncharacterized protein n=1 Tax=Puccinia graminis f. sp. tritici TaxID=56615 RepID=A0A5B0NY55_PUCGR|nr:hypothetical protein PGT21_010149 [Puccinia graminis f. sp. tritici]